METSGAAVAMEPDHEPDMFLVPDDMSADEATEMYAVNMIEDDAKDKRLE